MFVTKPKFATAINCIDGRTQLPVINYLRKRLGVDYIDVITEPAPAKILAENKSVAQLNSIQHRFRISQEKHGSECVAVVAHYDCAGNPVEKEIQLRQVQQAVETIRSWGFAGTILALWVDENWRIHEIKESRTGG